jgi:hypothetical protein
MVQAVENFPFFESWRKHRNRQLCEAWRKVFQELSQKGAQVGEFHCVGGASRRCAFLNSHLPTGLWRLLLSYVG